jgi:hypothetical protein
MSDSIVSFCEADNFKIIASRQFQEWLLYHKALVTSNGIMITASEKQEVVEISAEAPKWILHLPVFVEEWLLEISDDKEPIIAAFNELKENYLKSIEKKASDVFVALQQKGYSPNVLRDYDSVSLSFPSKSVFVVVEADSITVSKVHVDLNDFSTEKEEYRCESSEEIIEHLQKWV